MSVIHNGQLQYSCTSVKYNGHTTFFSKAQDRKALTFNRIFYLEEQNSIAMFTSKSVNSIQGDKKERHPQARNERREEELEEENTG